MIQSRCGERALGFLCASTSWGGLEMNVLRLARWMQERGWTVYLYGQPDSRLGRAALAAGITVRRLQPRLKRGDPVSACRLARYVVKDGVRYLFSNEGKDLLLTVLAKVLSRARFRLIHLQHMHVGGHKRDFFHTWEYRRLDAWIAPLPMFRQRLMDRTRLDPDKIHVIPFGIELDRFVEHLPPKGDARRRLGLPGDALVAGIVGRLDVGKGQDVLVRACAEVHRAGIPLHLLMVGESTANDSDAYANHLRSLVTDLELGGFVHFRPFMPDVEQAYAAMDLFVLASHSETYGMVTIEAMAAGLPVIGTAAGGTVEIIRDGETGLLAPPQDVAALTEALLRLISDPDLRERLGATARGETAARFSHVRQCESVERLLDLLGDPARNRR